MATHDYDIANQSGSAFRADLNNALQAIVSINSSATQPTTTFAYQYWVDTSASPALLKQRNAANDAWIIQGQIGGQLYLTDGTVAAPSLAFEDDRNTGFATTAEDQISVVTGGTERVSAASSTLHFYGNGGAADSYRFYKDGSANHGKLSFESLTANRTFTFPDSDGTVLLSTSTVTTATNATNADNVQVDTDTSDSTRYVAFADGGGGNDRRVKVDGGLTYNPSTNRLTAGSFNGPLTGNVTGNVTGNLTGNVTGVVTGDVVGNASTATTASNANNLGGVAASGYVRDNGDTLTGAYTFGGSVTFNAPITANSDLNVRGALDLADNDRLKFGSGDDVHVFTTGSNFYISLYDDINNFYIVDEETSVVRFTFDRDTGDFTAHGDITTNNSGTFGSLSVTASATVGGNITATQNITANGNLNGTLGNTQVRNAISLGNSGNLGTYALLKKTTSGTTGSGSIVSGSFLRFSSAAGNSQGTPNGTWRCMGRALDDGSQTGEKLTTVWLRVT